jgi:hypothetical protein
MDIWCVFKIKLAEDRYWALVGEACIRSFRKNKTTQANAMAIKSEREGKDV